MNRTAEKAMELMLPLKAKTEAKPEQVLAISDAEISEYVGTYTNKPESAEIVMKEGRLVLKRENGEFPITKIGNYRFSFIKPSESQAEELCWCVPMAGEVSAHRAACVEEGAS